MLALCATADNIFHLDAHYVCYVCSALSSAWYALCRFPLLLLLEVCLILCLTLPQLIKQYDDLSRGSSEGTVNLMTVVTVLRYLLKFPLPYTCWDFDPDP